MIIISISAISRVSPDAVAILEMWRRTWRGVVLAQLGKWVLLAIALILELEPDV